MRACRRRLLSAICLALLGACADPAPADDDSACERDDQCPGGQSCRAGSCEPTPCDAGSPCDPGFVCADGRCAREEAECRRDSDCTGERCPGDACRCAEGQCVANACDDGDTRPCRADCLEGVERCNQGSWRRCSAAVAESELCGDAVDNNCDGRTDDEDPFCGNCREGDERPCRTACGTGVERCGGERWLGCTAAQPRPETCGNEADDDCDSAVDEDCAGCRDGDARPCSTRCGDGDERCEGGRWRDCSAPEPTGETCNGQDDDCDGQTDEQIVRECDNACGSGVEACREGRWAGCTAPEECPCQADVTDEQVCGLCGVRSRECRGEAWQPWSECVERRDVCTPGMLETTTCGTCGTQRRACTVDCAWGDWEACRGEGECPAGATEEEACPNGCGVRRRTCSESCGWGAWGRCEGAPGADACGPGETEERPCGDACGVQRRTCGEDCVFGPWGPCADEGECRPSDEDAEACAGACSSRVRVCTADCRWGAFGQCRNEGQCTPDDRETRPCGLCGEQSRTCDDGCLWSDWSECQGSGDCTPGDREEQVCGESDVGECQLGVQVRTCDQDCTWTPFDACRGNVDPRPEVCGDGTDQDCDGRDRRDPDGFEPNDACDACRLVHEPGETDPNVFLDATIDSPDDPADFYCFDAVDNFSAPGFTEQVRVTLERIPNGTDYDLYLYETVAACRARQPLALSNGLGSVDESIEWGERLNHDDGTRYVVEVRRFTGQSCSGEYRLSIDGLR